MPPHVLVIDDDRDLRRALVRRLERLGCAARAVTTLAEARRALASGPGPDVLLVERPLPDGCGLAFARSTKAAHPSLRVVVMSPDALPPGSDAGLDAVLVKPFATEALRAALALPQ